MKKLTSLLLTLFTFVILCCGCFSTDGVTRGEKTETAYTNASIGLTFTKPDSWRFYTDEEIAATMKITSDLYKDKDLINSVEVASVIEFLAADAVGNNVNLTIENLKPSGASDITVEEYAEKSKELIAQQVQGMKYTFGATSQAEFAGKTFYKMEASCAYLGITMEQYIYMNKVGHHMVVITATSQGSMKAEAFEKMFS